MIFFLKVKLRLILTLDPLCLVDCQNEGTPGRNEEVGGSPLVGRKKMLEFGAGFRREYFLQQ